MDEGGGQRNQPRRARGGPAAAALSWAGARGPAADWAAAAGPWLAHQWAAEIEARRLFLWLPACMGLGILLYFAADTEPSLWAPLSAAAVFAGATFALRRSASVGFRIALGLATVFVGFS